jgi:hypothetical protein
MNFRTLAEWKDAVRHLTNEEAAKRLGIKPQTLAAWRCGGKGPKFLKVGRACLYRESDVEDWLVQQLRTPIPKQQRSAA